MAKLEITLSKEKFDALDEKLKEFYKANQEGGYELEGVGSIQRALEAEKTKNLEAIEKAKKDALAAFDGIDPEKAKAALAAIEQAETDKLTKKGEWDTLKAQLEDRHANELKKAKDDHDRLISNLKREQTKNLLTSRGVLPDRIKAAIAEGDFDNLFELESGESGFSLKKKGGIGDDTEMDGIFTELKTKAPYLFAANSSPGSGASPGTATPGGIDLNSMSAEQMLDMANAATTK